MQVFLKDKDSAVPVIVESGHIWYCDDSSYLYVEVEYTCNGGRDYRIKMPVETADAVLNESLSKAREQGSHGAILDLTAYNACFVDAEDEDDYDDEDDEESSGDIYEESTSFVAVRVFICVIVFALLLSVYIGALQRDKETVPESDMRGQIVFYSVTAPDDYTSDAYIVDTVREEGLSLRLSRNAKHNEYGKSSL